MIKFPALGLSMRGEITWSNSAAGRELEIAPTQEIYNIVWVADHGALHAILENPKDEELCFSTRILSENHTFVPVLLHLTLRRAGHFFCVITPASQECKKLIGAQHTAIFEAFRSLPFDSLLRTLAHSLRRWTQSDFVIFCKHPGSLGATQRIVSYSFSTAAPFPKFVLDFLQRKLTRGGVESLAKACADSFGFAETLVQPIRGASGESDELWGHLIIFETKISPMASVRKLLIEHIVTAAEDMLGFKHVAGEEFTNQMERRPKLSAHFQAFHAKPPQYLFPRKAGAATKPARVERAGASTTPDPTTLLANISHEIRTPLSGIAGIVSLLETTELSETQRTYVEALARSAESMRRIVNDCFDLSGLRTKGFSLSRESLALVPLLKEIALNHRVPISEKGLRFFVDFPIYEDVLVEADRVRLRQVIDNLLVNARKYTANGSVMLTLKQVQNDVIIEVRDTGRGISDENLDQIFKRFFQEESQSQSFSNGLGIGLTISKQIIDMMGGQINVKRNESGIGTTFSVVLPKLKSKVRQVTHASPLGTRFIYIVISDDITLLRCAQSAKSECLHVITCLPSEPIPFSEIDRQSPLETDIQCVLITDGLTQAMTVAFRNECLGSKKAIELRIMHSGMKEYLDDHILYEPFCWDDVFAAVDKIRPQKRPSSPLEIASNEQRDQTRKLNLVPDCPFGTILKPRVLIAEDDEVNQFVLRQYVMKLGLEVDLTSNGREALDLIESDPTRHALYIFDFMMPELDGVSLAAAIRQRERDLCEPKRTLIALTADATDRRAQICLEAGFDIFLTKPVKLMEFRNIVQRLLVTESNSPSQYVQASQ